ncbi:MAG: hypothetical protein PVJ53_14490 [Desulfobacterales bacterium]|jgi:hypothetical protein
MSLSRLQLHRILLRQADAVQRLATLYDEMDVRYAAAAENSGFECQGCDDNCCRTRFYHHTLVEIVGLFSGYRKLPENQRGRILARARDYCRRMNAGDKDNRPQGQLCPLNLDTRCLLYGERPMICRLHGIPHVMRHPLRGLISGPGCHMFETVCRPDGGNVLDRTPLYTAMANLEKSLRSTTGFETPVRLTIAQMIVCFET